MIRWKWIVVRVSSVTLLTLLVGVEAIVTPKGRTTTSQYYAVTRTRDNWSCEEDSGNPQRSDRRNAPLSESPMECEGAAVRLDFAVIETKKVEGAYLIIVVRLGKGESSKALNRLRLASAEEYILRRGSDLKYVLAEGKRTPGLGRLELYVSGRLYELMPFKKNAKGYCVGGESE